jgi:hypothetical protein
MVDRSSDQQLATSVVNLWPHREHESNALKNMCCRVGLHRWRRLDLREIVAGRDIEFCFWCSKVRIDGVAHDP